MTKSRHWSTQFVVLILACWGLVWAQQAPQGADAQKLTQLRQLAVVIEVDRQLLTELRKDFPDDRAEAEAYIQRLRELAVKSDPVRLGPLAARVGEAAPAYLNWRDKNFTSSEEAAREFVQSGAREFRNSFTNFTNAILQAVVNHLDSFLDIVGTGR